MATLPPVLLLIPALQPPLPQAHPPPPRLTSCASGTPLTSSSCSVLFLLAARISCTTASSRALHPATATSLSVPVLKRIASAMPTRLASVSRLSLRPSRISISAPLAALHSARPPTSVIWRPRGRWWFREGGSTAEPPTQDIWTRRTGQAGPPPPQACSLAPACVCMHQSLCLVQSAVLGLAMFPYRPAPLPKTCSTAA